MPAMQFDQHLDQMRANTGPDDAGRRAAAIITIEQLFAFVRWNAGARVMNGKTNLAFLAEVTVNAIGSIALSGLSRNG